MCLETAGDAKDKACLRSVQGKGSGSWLEAVPSSEKLALNPSEFCLAALLRIGCKCHLEVGCHTVNVGKFSTKTDPIFLVVNMEEALYGSMILL